MPLDPSETDIQFIRSYITHHRKKIKPPKSTPMGSKPAMSGLSDPSPGVVKPRSVEQL
jgi:hypothetical protein